MTLSRCSRLVAAALLLCATVAVGASGAAAAWSDGACPTTDGVTVVVDFGELGGGVHVRCAPQPVTSGFDALRQAGIDYRTTVRHPGFLCRIAGRPEADPCVTTSPATAYWSYWLAPRGGQWCFANLGAGNRVPPPGSVEGWSFALNRSATTAQPPAYPVPVALAGTQPAQLSPSDCVGATPVPATTAPPAGTGQGTPTPSASTPVTSQPAPDRSATIAGAVTASPDSPPASAGDSASSSAATAGGAEPTGDAAATDGERATTTNDTAPAGGGNPDDGPDEHVGSTSDENAGDSVDLGGAGEDGGSPLGVVAAAVLVAALGGAAAHIRRRQSATAQG